MEFHSIDTLKAASGLRLVIVKGVPSPWAQAAKAMIEYKGLPYLAGLQIPRGDNPELLAWAGTNSGPVVASEDEPPVNNWLDVLNLLERLQPERPLLPERRSERAQVIGIGNEICGVLGLGWNRRLSMYQPALESGNAPEPVVMMSRKYGYNPEDAGQTAQRQVDALQYLDDCLASTGSGYLVGSGVTAADFYWAAFSIIFRLPEADRVPLAPERRAMFDHIEPTVDAALTPALIAHRDRMLAEYFRLPMEF